MKRTFILAVLYYSLPAVASTWNFSIPRAGEVGLTIQASVPGTSWAKAENEAVILTLKVDGKHNQDVTLFMGATPHEYSVLLGPLTAGKHRLDYSRNEMYSSIIFGRFKTSFKA